MPVGGDRARSGDDVSAGGLPIIPDRKRAVVVLPENVALAVAVEISGTGNMPAARNQARIGNDMPAGGLPIVPERDHAATILPENIALAIAVEVKNGVEVGGRDEGDVLHSGAAGGHHGALEQGWSNGLGTVPGIDLTPKRDRAGYIHLKGEGAQDCVGWIGGDDLTIGRGIWHAELRNRCDAIVAG